MASIFGKNKKEKVVEQPITETKKNERKLSITIEKTYSNNVKDELKNRNIDFECDDNGNYETLRIAPEFQKNVAEIKSKCEADYLNRKLDNRISDSKNENPKKDEREVISIGGIKEELKNILDNELSAKKIWHEIRTDKDEEIYINCYADEQELVCDIYEELNFELQKTLEIQYEIEKHEKKKTEENQKNSKRKLGRTEQLKVRFTPDEMKIIQEKINLTGKKQGDFVREMLLEGYVKAFPTHANDLTIIQEIQTLNSNLGKLSGAMVKIMQQTAENSNLSKEERDELQSAINGIKKLRTDIKKEVKELWH